MKNTILNFLVFSSVLLFLLACEKDTAEQISFDYEYYDLTPGRFCIYSPAQLAAAANLAAVTIDTLAIAIARTVTPALATARAALAPGSAQDCGQRAVARVTDRRAPRGA